MRDSIQAACRRKDRQAMGTKSRRQAVKGYWQAGRNRRRKEGKMEETGRKKGQAGREEKPEKE
jgi:hypothetical protein